MHTDFVNIDWQGRAVRMEHQWLNANLTEAPLLVFLHEGLGSLAMWRDFPGLGVFASWLWAIDTA
jgi:hypothetical protein